MDTTASSPKSAPKTRSKGTFYYLFSVIGVAFIVATLFTAWSDPGLLPNVLIDSFTLGIAPGITPTPSDLVTPTPRTTPLIGIVAGHSGNDSGAVCPDGLTEASVNAKVAAFVQQYLVDKGYDADILEEFDPRLSGYNADVLISIHADSCDYINDQASGFKVSSALANPYPDRAARLTGCLRNRYAQVTGMQAHNSITIDMTSYHAFAEIDKETTAAIIEVGFLNLDKEKLTKQPDLLAQGITSGILCYLNNEPIDISQ